MERERIAEDRLEALKAWAERFSSNDPEMHENIVALAELGLWTWYGREGGANADSRGPVSDLQGFSVAQLRSAAKALGVELRPRASKKEIMEAILAR